MTAATLLRGFQERTYRVRGDRVRAYVGGQEDGEPVVLLHGLGGAALNWALVAPTLARTRRVVMLDLPGHAGSDPLPAAPTLAPYADRVAAAAEREGLRTYDVVGHSFGGIVALRLAIRRPEAVRSVVLAAAAGITSSTRAAERALALVGWLQPSRKVSRYWRAVGRSAVLRRILFAHWLAADPVALGPDAVEALMRDVGLHTDTDAAWRALTRDDPRRDLHLVGCPSLVVWGSEDNQLPLADGYDYARRLRAPIRVIADCGHLLIVERPRACVDAIESFLASR